ncbi:TIGR03986 family type III CRISPR-associated RAMP protein [Actinomadura latina]|uniref:TIGR03986 family CRISPR-associated RAMP protein n=1 Tax=Actinomadura latina TaxID=163603 RepID=A0A846Z7T1_9ACTN|nr:TIGR03986 family CRISPR-associated RAMP protein [Actinomadura latina]NKZ07282.1 TIGR03986 family CRISPR-associated RAMP protein [Actinomadura latina]
MTENKPPTPKMINVGNRFDRGRTQRPARTTAAPAKRPPAREQPRARNNERTETEHKESFLNPYTFVPAFSRRKATGAFADRRPDGADRLHEPNWTGTIGVRLTVQTPLLLLDTARAFNAPGAEEGHLTYPVLLRNDRPHLPATAIKGMLRSAYEAITNSRFGVFTGHEEVLGWRRVVDDARHMKPVRVSEDGRSLEFWHPVKLSCYRPKPGPKYPDGRSAEHGDHVWVKVVKGQNADEVDDIVPHQNGAPGADWEEGYAFVTGENAERKRDERVFVRRRPDTEELTGRLCRRWEALMEHHRELQKRTELQSDYAISPHREKEERRRLTPGTFCWAYKPGAHIEALYPVMVPRELALRSPAEMVPPKVEPAPSYQELSPADRVFGWVAQDEGTGTRPAAYRGRLRVADVTCVTPTGEAVVRFAGRGLPLAILAQPKPNQGRFYLSRSAAEPHRPIDPRTPKHDVHRSPDRTLRGRKAYWHHKQAAENENYWDFASSTEGDPTQQLIGDVLYREYMRPNTPPKENAIARGGATFETTDQQQRDKQNRSILGWIAKDTEFTFTIDVRDVPDVELGALLWLLDLEDDCHHRLGLGKPLGFGSVQLSLDCDRTKLHTGAQWSQYYRNLTGELPDSSPADVKDTCVKAFEAAAQKQPGFAATRLAFLAAARGRDDIPVHYPRTTPQGLQAPRTPPNPAGESFSWFTANERARNGQPVNGRGRSLPAAGDPQGRDLDVYPREN